MEQFILVPAPVYNRNGTFNHYAVTKQQLPKYQADQNPTHQNDSLKKETNRRLFAKGDALVDIIWFCPGKKLSNSRTLKLDVVESEVLLSDFAQQQHCENADVLVMYFTLLDAAGI